LRRLGREEFRQRVGTQTHTEYRPIGLKGYAGIERSGVNRVESEPIDEAHHGGYCVGVIAGGSHCETIRRARRSPSLFKLEVAKVVEALDYSRQRKMLLHDETRAHRRCRQVVVKAVNLLPIVHGVDEDLAVKEIAGKVPETVHGHGQDKQLGVMDDVVGYGGVSAGGKDVNNELDAIDGAGSGDGDVVAAHNCRAGDGGPDLPSSNDAQV
jgi:hypothetical protein